jgi:hypothetical protein
MQGSKGLEFSFDKGLLDHLDQKPTTKEIKGKKHATKGKDFARPSQFHARGRRNRPGSAEPEEAYPSAFQVRRNLNAKAIAPENADAYGQQLYSLHTVHTNLLTFLATEREAMTQKHAFQPQITFKGRHMFEGTDKTVADRSEIWIERRDAKLKEAREALSAQKERDVMAATSPIRPVSRSPGPNVTSKLGVYWEPRQTRWPQGDRPVSAGASRTMQTVYMASTGQLSEFIKKSG